MAALMQEKTAENVSEFMPAKQKSCICCDNQECKFSGKP